MEVHAKEEAKAKPGSKAKKAKKAKKSEEEEEEEEEAESVEVLTDILLSLLLKQSGLLRDVVKRVFEAISGEVSQGAFKLLLRVVESQEGEDDVMGEEEDEEDEEDDEEMEPIEPAGASKEEEEDGEEEDEEEEDDEDDEEPISLMQEDRGEVSNDPPALAGPFSLGQP